MVNKTNSIQKLINLNLLNLNKNIIVGVSGGPDSMFLLKEISNVAKNIIVCHVNYNARKSSNYDEQIVKQFCQKNNIKLEILNINSKQYLNKNNFQSLARNIRYDFFCQTSIKYNTNQIAVGHHQTDLLETFLIQSKRNIYPNYYGLDSKTIYVYKNNNFQILRPILSISKKNIQNYLDALLIPYALDPSNKSKKYLRNKIRLELIPELDVKKTLIKIQDLNKKLIEFKTKVLQNAFYENKILVDVYKNLTLEFKVRLIYHLIKIHNHEFLIKKKSQIVKEIVKQFETNKNHIFILNHNFFLLKNKNYICFKKNKNNI